MKLPNADRAEATPEKITGYPLSREHPDGRNKAAYFEGFGYTADPWEILAYDLKRHAADHEVTLERPNPFGVRYGVEGPLPSPDGRAPSIRSVWFIEAGSSIPRLVTAYPTRRKES